MEKKIIVIGGGPAGYAASIRAAQLGASVTLAEEHRTGGVCLNAGCVPVKALLGTAEFYRRAVNNAIPGVNISGAAIDWGSAQKHKDDVVTQLARGVDMLLRRNGVMVRNERAVLMSSSQVMIGAEILPADAVILASGSSGSELKPSASERKRDTTASIDVKDVLDSAGALSLENIPESIIIIGGGVIGVEFAELFNSLGVKTAIIELAAQILPSADAEIAEYMRMKLEYEGVSIHTKSQFIDAKQANSGVKVRFSSDRMEQTAVAEKLLIAVGRSPNTQGLGLEEAGVKVVRGAIAVDEYFQTNEPGIYAVGDCNGKAMLAHAAMVQGETAAEHILGVKPRSNNSLVPSCIYTSPEVSFIGKTEEQLKNEGVGYSAGRFDLAGNAMSVIKGAGGFVKILADCKLGEILGVHIAGPNASELIAGAAVCMNMEGTVEDIVNTIHPHPTVSEAMREAAMSVFGKAIHGL